MGNFAGNLKEKLTQFMYGRYGTDQLYYVLIGLYFVLVVANAFLNLYVLSMLMWAVLLLTFFRTFSRNLYKRRMENEKLLKVWSFIKSKYSFSLRRIKEIKTHRYRKCPNCKAFLRLPRKTGKHTVKCPKCYKEFEVQILC